MSDFVIRPLLLADAPTVARHRAAMFRDMGDLPADQIETIVSATIEYVRAAIDREEYHGWLASPPGAPDVVAGGAGIYLRPLMPRPNVHGPGILTGQQGLIMNVYVEPPFRRQGLARHLVETVLTWAQARRLASVVLHAAPAGRPLYERLGFVATNEMRYARPSIRDGK